MLKPDTILQNRYKIVRLLGEGGQGAVYLAEDGRHGNLVALKETPVEHHLREEFEREAQLLAKFQHPGLPKVKDYFIEDGGQFLVMEFIPGDDLEEIVELMLANLIVRALEYMQKQEPPVIQRDMMPIGSDRARERYAELIDKKFTASLSSDEQKELSRLEKLMDEAEAPLYDQTIERLKEIRDKLSSDPSSQ